MHLRVDYWTPTGGLLTRHFDDDAEIKMLQSGVMKVHTRRDDPDMEYPVDNLHTEV